MSNIILAFVAKYAYWICLFVGMFGLIAYITGFKKGGKVSILCVAIYWIVAATCSI